MPRARRCWRRWPASARRPRAHQPRCHRRRERRGGGPRSAGERVDAGGGPADRRRRPALGRALDGRGARQDPLRGPDLLSWAGARSRPNPRELREIHGKGQRGSVCPVDTQQSYWWAAFNAPLNEIIPPERRKALLLERYAGWPFGLPEAIAATPDGAILQNDLVDRPPARQYARGRVVLVGDAAHPTTPNLGQGANMAIDDAIVLARALRDADSLATALARYERERLERTRLIVKRSWSFGRPFRWTSRGAVKLRETLIRHTPARVTTELLRWQILESVGGLEQPYRKAVGRLPGGTSSGVADGLGSGISLPHGGPEDARRRGGDRLRAPAATSPASGSASSSKKAIVVEQDKPGGICLNVGCIPSKALINAVEDYDKLRHGADIGILADNLRVDMAKHADLEGRGRQQADRRRAHAAEGERRRLPHRHRAPDVAAHRRAAGDRTARPPSRPTTSSSRPARGRSRSRGSSSTASRIVDSTGALDFAAGARALRGRSAAATSASRSARSTPSSAPR